MTVVPVALGDRSYDILIEAGAIDRAADLLAPWQRGGRWIVVTEETVHRHQFARLEAALSAANVRIEPIVLPPGEGTKNWDMLRGLCERLLELEVERSESIIALGGGVIGDLVGFAASIVKRGCGFIQVPTTLLSQVDSSVGGKTAINSAHGKNLVGAFHQPRFVLIDPTVLDTLPRRELAAGYAEVVKYGLLGDFEFYQWCEANSAALLAGDPDARAYAIEMSVRAKARIVIEDERETADLRALLNLGHTFGHALEAETGYSDKLLHGEAVAAGMALAFRYSARRGLCEAQDAGRVAAHLRAVGLPQGLDEAGVSASGALLAGHMAHDKKKSGGRVPFILARGIGDAYVDKQIELNDVAAFLDTEPR